MIINVFRYLDLAKIVNKLMPRPGGSTSGSSFIRPDLTITGHKAAFISGQDLFLKSVTNCTDYIYISFQTYLEKKIQFWNCLICNLVFVICCNLAGPGSNRYGWPDLQPDSSNAGNLHLLSFSEFLVSASHWKEWH